MTPRPDRCGTSSRAKPARSAIYLCGLTVQSGAAHRSPALRRQLRRAAPLAAALRLRGHVHPQHHRHRRQGAGQGARAGPAVLGDRLRQRAAPRRRLPRAQRAAADLRAARHRAHPRDARADQAADRRGPRVRGRRRQRRRLLRRARPTRTTARCPGSGPTTMQPRRRRPGAGQARPARLRAVEGRQARRAGRTPYWPSPWGRGRPGWHIECSAMCLALPRRRSSTSTAAGST